jgi:hypothetical protein
LPQPADPAAVEAEERAARRAVRDRKLAILEQLYWHTDFRREALARANAELGTPTTCEPPWTHPWDPQTLGECSANTKAFPALCSCANLGLA